MGVSGEPHTPASFHPGKEPSVLFEYEVGWDPELARTLMEKRKISLISITKSLNTVFEVLKISERHSIATLKNFS
jgi:hypothetical protein